MSLSCHCNGPEMSLSNHCIGRSARAAKTRFAARVAVAALALGVLVSPAIAAAGDPETTAAEIFRAAEAAYARGEYRAAALSFEAAFKQAPHGGAMYNAGVAWEAAGEKARAADAYHAALAATGLNPQQGADALARLSRLEPLVAMVDITLPRGATASLAHAEHITSSGRVHVMPGEHDARVVFTDGQTRSRRIRAVAGQVMAVTFDALPEKQAPAPVPVPAPPPGGSGGSAQRTAGWIMVGGGVVLSGAAVYLGVRALEANDEFDAGGHTDADARDRTLSLRAWTNVAWIAAGLTGGTGIVLVLTSPSPPAPHDGGAKGARSAGPSLCAGPLRVAVCGRF
jgi:hypothetical protein